MDIARGRFLAAAAGAAGAAALPPAAGAQTVELPMANGTRPLAAFPQKRPLILLTPRPPQLETPFEIFDRGTFTPNDAFFVRWHLAGLPRSVDAAAHRVVVRGAVERQLSLSLDDLAQLPAVEIAAVNQCSGNGRGLSDPRVAGGQWANGAMGNALWTGVRLRDVLERAGVKASAVAVQFEGLDEPPVAQTPKFRKALDLDTARGADVLVAYGMNGAALPFLNGYPVRLVVPGYYSTYWVKMLSAITVLEAPDDNFWMKTAYRIPDTPDNSVSPSATGYPTIPIGRMRVRSFITNVMPGARLRAGRVTLRGIAFDGGSGIRAVAVSADGGATWHNASLERDEGNYGFRRWGATIRLAPGSALLAARATANDGGVQPMTAGWNPSGYLRNVVERVPVTAG